MKAKPLPSRERLLQRLDYDPKTGEMTWKERPPEDFSEGRYPTARQANIWNGKFAGKPALASPMANGYLHGALDSTDYLQHRIIWKLVTGDEPEFVDHVNGIRDDNRWENLRSTSVTQNMRNRRLPRNNTSGVMGVHWDAKANLWCATIVVLGRLVYLGRYANIDEAARVRKTADLRYGFSSRHGSVE